MKITELFIKRSSLTHLITLLIILIGGLVLFNLNQTLYPKVNFDIMVISTIYPGASSEDVEVKVTNQIEDELKEVEGIDYTRSYSLENLSIIYVWVDVDHSDPKEVKDEIRRAVNRVSDLPAEITERPFIDELRSSNTPVMEVALIADNQYESSLRKLADNLEDEILEIKGIASVDIDGYRKKEIQILANQSLLIKNQITLDDIIRTIQSHNLRISAGDTSSSTDSLKIITFSEFDQTNTIGDLIIRSNTLGKNIKIKDVAEVKNTFEDFEIEARTNGSFSINLLIKSQNKGDVTYISQELNQIIEKYRSNLSKDIQIEIIRDFSEYTVRLLDIVKNNALIGFVLVLICLFIFLTPRIAFWTATGIPLSVLGAIIFFPLLDIEINFISLITMILVLGLLVDDAIVIAENITRYRENGYHPIDAAIQATKEVFWPVLATIITTILAFSSILFMKGVTGKFVHQIPLVVILTLGFSLIEATIILPAHIALSKKDHPRKLLWFEKIKNFYGKILNYFLSTLARKLLALGLFICLFVGSGLLFLDDDFKFILFPYDDVDIFYILAELPNDKDHDFTRNEMTKIEKIIQETISLENMDGYTTRIGHHNTSVYGGVREGHSYWAMVTIYMKKGYLREITTEEVMADLQPKLNQLKEFDRIMLEKYNDGPPVGKPITIDLMSDDDALRSLYSQKIYQFLEKVPGIENLDIDDNPGKNEFFFKPKLAEIAKHHITPLQIGSIVRTAVDGQIASTITRDGEEIDFRVKLRDQDIESIEQIKKLAIRNIRGNLVSLEQLANFEIKPGIESIKHYNARRATRVTAEVNEQIISSSQANQLIRENFLEKINQENNLTLIFGGEEKATQESLQSFKIAFILSLFAIYCVLAILFNSLIIKPLTVLIAIPFGISGVIISFYTHGIPMSFLGLIGSLGLIGIVINDALIMVSFLSQTNTNQHPITTEQIVEGSIARFRPVILTTVTTVAGLIPAIYGFGGSEPFLIPIVLSVAGGLVFATGVILILIPVLFSLFHEVEYFFLKPKEKKS